jgi:hypothetical protein
VATFDAKDYFEGGRKRDFSNQFARLPDGAFLRFCLRSPATHNYEYSCPIFLTKTGAESAEDESIFVLSGGGNLVPENDPSLAYPKERYILTHSGSLVDVYRD